MGAYLGRNVGYGLAIVCYLLAFACLIGMRFAVRSSAGLSVGLPALAARGKAPRKEEA